MREVEGLVTVREDAIDLEYGSEMHEMHPVETCIFVMCLISYLSVSVQPRTKEK